MLWLALLSPVAALTFLLVMQWFETWMLAAAPARASVRRASAPRRGRRISPVSPAVARALVPRPRTPQSS